MKNQIVILKVTERCNLNCSYCYYFNGLDRSFESKPAIMKKDISVQVAEFLAQGIDDYQITSLGIAFHGGEPMLLSKSRFSEICDILLKKLKPKLKSFQLILQTNGTLIDEDWIKIFKKYQISLGISLDGLRKNHDLYRVDHKGRGSYDKTLKSMELLKEKNYKFGVLSVIDPSYPAPAEEVFKQMVVNLGLNGIDFLWPHFTHDNPPECSPLEYGKQVSELFHCWVKHGDPKIKIRFFNSNLNLILGGHGLVYGQGLSDVKEKHVFCDTF
jgi:uncharacterized protein